MTTPAELFATNLEAAFRVGTRLLEARRRLTDILPLELEQTPDRLATETVVWVDAFLKRWENFQDLLENQLIQGLVILEGESDHVRTRRDRAYFLEKLELVETGEDWFAAGQLRNKLAHGYPLSDPKQVQRINAAYEQVALLTETFNRIRGHALDRDLAQVTVPALET